MGKIPKNRSRPPAKVPFLFREDLINIDKISNEIKLLARYRIDTSEQLFSYKTGLTERMGTLTAERAELRKHLRRLKEGPSVPEIKGKIAILSAALGEARKEMRLCDDIAKRTEQIKEKTATVKQEQNRNGKERKRYEPFRGRG